MPKGTTGRSLSWHCAPLAPASLSALESACCTQGASHSAQHACIQMAAQRTVLSALPLPVAQRIFSSLPVDLRARCACVCRGWRSLLDDASLWARLDLSDGSGVTCRFSDRVLRGAAARAGGALQALDFNRGGGFPLEVQRALLEVVQANRGTLRELHTAGLTSVADLEVLLRAAPALRTLSAGSRCGSERALELLRNEPPYGPLRLHTLTVEGTQMTEDAAVLSLAAALPAHASLRSLALYHARSVSDATCGALIDSSLALPLQSLTLFDCVLPLASASALARLLGGGMLTELHILGCQGLLDDAASATVLAAALRACTTLTSLSLADTGLWREHLPGTVLLDALTGHPSVHLLNLNTNAADGLEAAAAAGAALGALVAADVPALTALNSCYCELDDAGLGPLVDALPRNTHLRRLIISDNRISEAFAAERLLPAVRANASLRELGAHAYGDAPSLAEAKQLVKIRAAAAAAAAGA